MSFFLNFFGIEAKIVGECIAFFCSPFCFSVFGHKFHNLCSTSDCTVCPFCYKIKQIIRAEK